jgi:integrase
VIYSLAANLSSPFIDAICGNFMARRIAASKWLRRCLSLPPLPTGAEGAPRDVRVPRTVPGKDGHRVEIDWPGICEAPGTVERVKVKRGGKVREVVRHSARLHDLRHTFASMLAGAGRSLPMIVALLGHVQP